MLIICTLDPAVVRPASLVQSWGNVYTPGRVPGSPALAQAGATAAMAACLALATPAEDICFSAHGNDEEIGGEGNLNDAWGWTAAEIAGMLNVLIQHNNWHGRVLFHVCCESIVNFSARVAGELGNLGRDGIWCYGYPRSVGSQEGVPLPAVLDDNTSLQGTRSGGGRSSRSRP